MGNFTKQVNKELELEVATEYRKGTKTRRDRSTVVKQGTGESLQLLK